MGAADRSIGFVVGSQIVPEAVPELARRGEALGYGELWLIEDLWQSSAMATAGAALGATSTLPVGIGIVSAMTRNPSTVALDCATLARIHPGRLHAGIGLGLPVWLRQLGVHPASGLAAVRESVTAVKRLLAGEELTAIDGPTFRFDAVKLDLPPTVDVPVYIGGIGPKMMQLTGEIADGAVASLLAGPEYIRWAREQLTIGARAAGRTDRPRLVVYALFCVDEDAAVARENVRPLLSWYLSAVPDSMLTKVCGASELCMELASGGTERVAREMPERWIDDFAIAGRPEECAAKLESFFDAGADAVALFPLPFGREQEMLTLAAEQVLPLVR